MATSAVTKREKVVKSSETERKERMGIATFGLVSRIDYYTERCVTC